MICITAWSFAITTTGPMEERQLVLTSPNSFSVMWDEHGTECVGAGNDKASVEKTWKKNIIYGELLAFHVEYKLNGKSSQILNVIKGQAA